MLHPGPYAHNLTNDGEPVMRYGSVRMPVTSITVPDPVSPHNTREPPTLASHA